MGLNSLNLNEKLLFDNYLSSKSNGKAAEDSASLMDGPAKLYTSGGGSLDKLVDVASKVLSDKNLDLNTRQSIYKNLSEAIEGKKDYYNHSTIGKIKDTLRSIPVLSKIIKSPIERAEGWKNSIDLRTNEQRTEDKEKLSLMYDYYINKADACLARIKSAYEWNVSDQNFYAQMSNYMSEEQQMQFVDLEHVENLKKQIKDVESFKEELGQRKEALSTTYPYYSKDSNQSIQQKLHQITNVAIDLFTIDASEEQKIAEE